MMPLRREREARISDCQKQLYRSPRLFPRAGGKRIGRGRDHAALHSWHAIRQSTEAPNV